MAFDNAMVNLLICIDGSAWKNESRNRVLRAQDTESWLFCELEIRDYAERFKEQSGGNIRPATIMRLKRLAHSQKLPSA